RPEDVEFLRGIAQIGSELHCPFVVGAAPSLLNLDTWLELPHPRFIKSIFSSMEHAAWRELRDDDASRYVYVTLPRFIGGLPHGQKGGRDGFRFIEGPMDHEAYAWVSSVYAVARATARAIDRQTWPAEICRIDCSAIDDSTIRCATDVSISDSRARELAD